MPHDEYYKFIDDFRRELKHPSTCIRYFQIKPATFQIMQGAVQQMRMFRMVQNVACGAPPEGELYKFCANRAYNSCVLLTGDCKYRKVLGKNHNGGR